MNTIAFAMIVLITVVLAMFAKSAYGCGGYKLEVEFIRNCNSDNVIELSKNFSMTLKNDCQLEFRGCITFNTNITDAEIDYIVQKGATKRSGKKNVCIQFENTSENIARALETLRLPNRCPITNRTVCLDNKSINVSKYKLGMNILVGHLKGKILMTANSGKFCVEFSTKLDNAFVRPFVLPPIRKL